MASAGQVQRELRQRRPFITPGAEAAVGILRTADVLRRFFNRILDPHDITLAQFNVLRILRGAAGAGMPTLEVASRLIEAAPGITLMMNRLVRKQLVQRRRARGDRRQVVCFLSAAGAQLLQRVDGPIDAADVRALAALSTADQRRLIRMLDAVRRDHAQHTHAHKGARR